MDLRKEFTMLMIKDYTVLIIPLAPPEDWAQRKEAQVMATHWWVC